MLRAEETPHNAEHKQAFLKFLPKRLDTLTKRGRRLLMGGWDINALNVLFQEVQTLAGASGRYGLVDVSELLFAIELNLAPCMDEVTLPDQEASTRFSEQLAQLARFIGREGAEPIGKAAAATKAAPVKSHVPLLVTPPNEYWLRWNSAHVDIPSPESAVIEVTPPPTEASGNDSTRQAVSTFTPSARGDSKPAEVPKPAPATAPDRSIYHLTDGNELALEIDKRLGSGRLPIEQVEDAAELIEVIGALTPAMVIVDAAFIESIDRIGETLRVARARASQKISFVVFTDTNDIATRLRAMRAGVDAFIVLPAAANEVMTRIQELADADASQPFRVLIVEDDRSQALFAESILRKAGMETRAVMDPLSALEELESFDPELILIDLYMPGCDGLELTTLIREREGFSHVPIVFLSGEHDEEKRFDALSAGGDDYLEKPIRPKHLISAVTNRVRRARGTQRRQPVVPTKREDAFGLSERTFVIDKLTEMLSGEDVRHQKGGVLFILVEGAHTIREKIGLTAFDSLLGQVSTFLSGLFAGRDYAARYGDTTFFALIHDLDEQELVEFATRIRQAVDKQIFEVGDRSSSVALSIGISAFTQNFGEAGAMLNAAERACALARKNPESRVAMFQTTVTKTTSGEDDEVVELLREAIRQDQLQLLFQPIASLRGSGEEQFQAFARLRADGGRMYSAGVIVPLAERNGLIHGFDRWTLTRCLMVIGDRMRENHPVRLFANQSIDCINDPQRPAWLKAQIDARQVNPANLVIELRTADAAARVRQVTSFAEAMKTIGIKLCLNGFESTMGNFQLLQHVPADYIKLAPKYTQPEGQTPNIRAELRQTITHVRERGIRIVAPQVEDAQCAAALWSTGVDYIQGDFVQQATQSLDFDFAAAAI
ncbi:MAG: EAL domain-containing protein [Ahniella sp.]|nr:EAL domain-containing protein [Ahniella sp.]